MDNSCNFLIAKFGREEHLKQLQNGEIYFNAVQAYRDDGTVYRGDPMEGKIPIDPAKIKLYDQAGRDIFETIPRPNTIVESLVGDENLMMFCASAITTEIMDYVANDIWKFKEEFKSEMQKFGDHVLLIWSLELLEHIAKATDITGQKIGFIDRRILYRDLKDFDNTHEYRITGSPLDVYFVKGLLYKNQNEWRVIIDGEREELKINCDRGFLLQTSPFQYSQIMKTTDFLNGEIKIQMDNNKIYL